MNIRLDNLESKEIARLLDEHLEDMQLYSPAESVHALDIASLQAPDVSFWSAWEGDQLAGCGALKELDKTHGEIKSMRTSRSHLRKGVAAKILKVILVEAKKRGYLKVSLETGSAEAYMPARRLYESFGFNYCAPFAEYVEDPYSVYMTKKIPV